MGEVTLDRLRQRNTYRARKELDENECECSYGLRGATGLAAYLRCDQAIAGREH